MKKPFIVAHRGASNKEYENTLKAYLKAIDLGSDYIECDVRETGDNKFILHHNGKVGRLHIKNSKYQDLRTEAQKRNYNIPTLHDLVRLAKGKIKLDVEIKEKGSETEITNILKNNLSRGDFVITSFFDSTIRAIKAADKNIICGLLCGFIKDVYNINGTIARAIKAKADFIVPNYKLLNTKYINSARLNNLPIWVWTVNNPEKIQKYIRIDAIEAIITDVPDIAMACRE